ncbi:hypothetical protein [Maridesulfovibrio sp.]|uniref:hypothetical protein n=1 Tax=Maridesulfovibrio sp. TaxID=2795000 RepID=UPI0029CA9293|nr:hypothetical protein [Maridesulfovibrio sp.]
MTYSVKTLIIAAMLFVSSMLIIGSMHLPLFNGSDGFERMENAFNSLRKGLKPPFQIIESENTEYLGKNINMTLVFRDRDEARIATMIFLRNKLTVTPKDRKVNIQGDLGYTLKFFMNDIYLLYMNSFKKLKSRYSMPATQSMYYLNRILQKMAAAMAEQQKYPQEKLIRKIREKLLIPAYNLREAKPVSETSGFTFLTLGTLGILLFAILWDVVNFLFFGTLESEDFMKWVRVKLGREMSDEQKKRIAIKKMKAAKAKKKQKSEQIKRIKSKRTNKEALQKKNNPGIKTDEPGAEKKAAKKRKVSTEDKTKARKKISDETPKIKPTEAKKKAATKKTARNHEKDTTEKKRSASKKNADGKVMKKNASDKKQTKPTSQTKSKKVTTQQGRKKIAAPSKPEAPKKARKKPTAQKAEKKPDKRTRTASKEIKPDEQ